MKNQLFTALLIASVMLNQSALVAQDPGNRQAMTSSRAVMKTTDTSHATKYPTCGILTYEGQTYHTVMIGTQCWMSENLNIGKWTDQSQMQKQDDNGVIEKYCFGNDFTQCDFWGGLYQWSELMAYTQTAGTQGICPPGWHIPASVDWKLLIRYLGTNDIAGGKMKSTLQWQRPNVGADNSSGFSAYPGGYYDFMTQQWHDQYRGGYFWSSEIITKETAVGVFLSFRTGSAEMYEEYQPSALSVRCIKN